MARIKLEKGQTHTMYVESVVNARKSFQRGDKTFYVHDIYFTSKDGDEALGEYVTTQDSQSDFVAGKGACFKVDYVGAKGVEILPCKQGPSERQGRDTTRSIAGESHTFAMGFAKDLICAKFNAGIIVENEQWLLEIQQVAWEINKWLTEPFDPGAPDPF